jgi:DNA-directed RNA polymerase subunit K/omega
MEAGKDKRISHGEFTKYELARVLGSRALQISHGSKPLIKLSKKKLEEVGYNPIEIAKLELEADVIPITVIRKLPGEE